MLARIQKCPESGKVWDAVTQTCRCSKAVEKLKKIAVDASKCICLPIILCWKLVYLGTLDREHLISKGMLVSSIKEEGQGDRFGS